MFISVEGGEGVGKTTFIQSFKEKLESAPLSKKVLCTREPGGTAIGQELRQIFACPPEDETLTVEAEFMIVSAARAQHVNQVIKPALEAGRWVLSDRYADSSRVYQGILGGLEHGFIEGVIEKTTYGLVPDLTIVLDCPVEDSLARLGRRNSDARVAQDGVKRFDEACLSTHQRLREAFLEVSKRFPKRILVLDALKPVEENVSICLDHLQAN